MDGKCQIDLGYDTDKGKAYLNVYGDVFIGDGKGKTTYIKYYEKEEVVIDTETGLPKIDEITGEEIKTTIPTLEIKAKLDVKSTIGDVNIAEYIANGKHKVFTEMPKDTDDYDVGDIWVNATYPNVVEPTSNNDSQSGDESGSESDSEEGSGTPSAEYKYKDDILICIVKKKAYVQL